ncbi:MAG: hypothetical protein M1838_003698 [Thelocarpon superellum]|nr:MAG: hypothetical protein M1838_003698 [Thelocarpon superellum]
MSEHSVPDPEKASESLTEPELEPKEPESAPGPGPSPPQAEDEIKYPPGKVVAVVMIAVYLAVFLIALDRIIITTAIPRITDDFHSLGDVGWYGSAYLLTGCSFQLFFGRVYTFYSPKLVFLATIAVFEIGSALCGAAPNSTAFIVGRAIAGMGTAGIFSGTMIIVAGILPLHKRPLHISLVGSIFAVASVAGPLMGGAFTQNVTWRWCFYINLPIGAATMVIIWLILELPAAKRDKTSLGQKIARLDPLGTLCFLPGIVCLLLALQWGGTTYAWSSWRIVLLLVLFVVLICLFVGIQVWKKESATVPPRIIAKRSVFAGVIYSTCTGGALITIVYFVPIWFQAVKGVGAVESGIHILPMMAGLVPASILAGALITRTGQYAPFMLACTVLISIGAGLISTFAVDTPEAKWIGYQFVFGFGLGLGMQQASTAAQAVLSRADIPTGVSLMFFGQTLGGSVFLSVAQNIFLNRLTSGLAPLAKTLSPALVVSTGATDLRTIVDPADLPQVLQAYNAALVSAFHVAVAVTSASIIGSSLVEWKNIKKVRAQKAGPPAAK